MKNLNLHEMKNLNLHEMKNLNLHETKNLNLHKMKNLNLHEMKNLNLHEMKNLNLHEMKNLNLHEMKNLNLPVNLPEIKFLMGPRETPWSVRRIFIQLSGTKRKLFALPLRLCLMVKIEDHWITPFHLKVFP
ncbi:hypothetical protein BgiMline_033476 [Biomphalaria glabrata]|nr:hypothetical protein BgiMline_024578 [Biomphalaria glabrata]